MDKSMSKSCVILDSTFFQTSTKGQLILKCLFGVFKFIQKQMEIPELSKCRIFFVRLFGSIEDTNTSYWNQPSFEENISNYKLWFIFQLRSTGTYVLQFNYFQLFTLVVEFLPGLSIYDVRKWNDPFERLFILPETFDFPLLYFVTGCAWLQKSASLWLDLAR